ncbi:MAG: hypothetical protein KAY22_23475 [Rhizorhabdus sp.]|uniref:hypothetical protein n=1 Tax=Rhizorhabdus sp. TaxID=1968843 RepID=UPI001B5606F9|nr:hypothetical protein [Rhizorhabdus sp.]MBP8235261.1 hypothetical protein [Rhizorhabdus sp.]
MSRRRYAYGELTRLLVAAVQADPNLTSRDLADRFGCSTATAYNLLIQRGIRPKRTASLRSPVVWTPEMKAVLLRGLLKRRSANAISRSVGVNPQTLFSGAAEIIRDLHEQREQS